MGTNIKAPPPRDYGAEMQQTLAAQIGMMPTLLSAQAAYGPQQNALNLSGTQSYLLGSQGGTQSAQVYMPEQWITLKDAKNKGMIQKVDGKWTVSNLGNQQGFQISGKSLYKPAGNKDVSYNLPAQRGMLDIYERDIYPMLSRVEAANQKTKLEGDLAAMQQYGQKYTDAIIGSNPAQKALLDEMNRQSLAELQAGQGLTPQESRMAQQSARAAFAARGLAGSNQSIAAEVLNNYGLGAQREAQRRAFAGQVLGYNKSIAGDPMMAVLGRASQLAPQGFNFGQQAIASGTQNMFNPESSYAGGIYNQNYQAKLATSTANAANNAGMIGGGISALGSIGGGFMGGGFFGGK